MMAMIAVFMQFLMWSLGNDGVNMERIIVAVTQQEINVLFDKGNAHIENLW